MRKSNVSTLLLGAITLMVATAIPSSAQTLTTVHNFAGPEGAGPTASLILARDGNFYGTTTQGGAHEAGAIFKMTPSGTVTVVYSLCSRTGCADGSVPYAGLLQGSDGNFYGSGVNGGVGGNSNGTAFKVTSGGSFTLLHTFCTYTNCNDGNGPEYPMIQARDGNYYGTTIYSGPGGGGVIYKITPSGTFSVFYGFDNNHGEILNGLIQGTDGNFYLTAYQGGAHNEGTVTRITPGGSATVLYNFCSQSGCSDGSLPNAPLIQASDGNFYGTTVHGGTSNYGTVFKITPSGTLTTLHSFNFNDGSGPIAPLIQGADGNFYGTTYVGGANNQGAIFGMTASGSLTLLHSFAGSDGAHPQGGLIQAANGSFYGTTIAGGSNNLGTIFQLTVPLIPTTTVLSSSPNPSYQGENVAMTATVTAQNGSTPQGTVIFKSNGTQVGSASLNSSGVAVLNFTGLAVGSDSLTAVYQGSPALAGSTSNPVTQVVHPASTTTVTSTPNPSTVGQSVTITAIVGPSGPPQPTGTVSFTSNGTAIAGCTNVALSNLTAPCTSAALPTGTDVIVATYSGDGDYGPSQGSVVQIVNPVPTAVRFVTLPPCRVVDTRNPNGTFGGPAIPGGTARSFPLAQSGNPCGIPADAVAYSLNVTAVPQSTLAYLTIWPSGEGQPTVSTLNSLDGRIKANAVIIPAGTSSGSVSVFVTNTTNVVLDINGYFTTGGGSTLAFYPVTPCRVVDTRNTNGPLGGPYLTGGQERDFPLLESNCGLPASGAAAYSLNFTVVPKTSAGVAYLTVWPQGQSKPLVSTLNDLTNTIVANAALVPAGTDGGIATFASNDTNLVVDVNGYFAPPGAGGLSFYALTPCRVIDTRHVGNGQPFTGELTVDVVHSACGPPATAQGYVFNATVVPTGSLSYLTLWPDTENKPVVSTLNALDGAITSNMAVVPNVNGKTDAFASGITQLILDITGYFAP